MKAIAYVYSDPLLEPIGFAGIADWPVDQIYHDIAVAWDDPVAASQMPWQKQQPQLEQLFSRCRSDPPDYLLVRQLGELGRTVEAVSDRLAALEDLGINVIAVESTVIDTTGPGSVRRANLLKLFHALQRDQRCQKIRQGHARNRLKALPPPGKAPYGYRRGKDRYVLDRSAAPIVKDFFEHFLLYGSLHGAVRYLGKNHGKKISVTTGRRWLVNPVYRGDLAYRKEQVLLDTHTPLLSREEAAQIDRLLRRNRRLPPRTASAPRSLAGLVICERCQSPLVVTRTTTPRKEREYLYLRSSHCPQQPKCRSLCYGEVLEQTIQLICQELPRAVAEVNSPDMNRHKREIEAGIARRQGVLQQLPVLVEQATLDQATADLRVYTLRTEIAELQGQLAQLPPVNLREIAQAVSITQFWHDLSEPERRFFFREFIRQVLVIRSDQEQWHLRLVFIF